MSHYLGGLNHLADQQDGWYHDHEHLDQGFVAADPFYQNFIAAYGGRYLAVRVLAPADDQSVLFALEIPPQRGPLDADERELARRLGIHIEDALRAYERVRRAQMQMLAGYQLLHTFAQPLWLIDLDRFVHEANTPAREETQRGRLLVQRGPQLAACTGKLDRDLAAMLHVLRSQPHGASRILRAQVPGELQPLWLHLSLLHPQQALGAFGGLPMVLISLFDPQQVLSFDPYALSSLLDLTPAQARVATGLAQGRTPQDIATASGTSVATVNTHLQKVLQRAGVRRTEELVRRLHEGHVLWGMSVSAD